MIKLIERTHLCLNNTNTLRVLKKQKQEKSWNQTHQIHSSFWDRVLCHQAGLQLSLCIAIYLWPSAPFPKYWDYKWTLPCLVYAVLGVEPRALCMLGKRFPEGSQPQATFMSFSYNYFWVCHRLETVSRRLPCLPFLWQLYKCFHLN